MKVKKILLMTDYYYPDPCANGVCLYEIAKELIDRGNEVHILSINNGIKEKEYEYDGVKVHSIRQDKIYYHLKKQENKAEEERSKLALKFWSTTNKMRFLLEVPNYPVTLPMLASRYYKKLESLHKKYNFSFYLSMFHPIHAVNAGIKLKKKYPQIKMGFYSLDSMTNDIKPFHFKEFKEKRDYSFEEKIHECSDVILNLKCHEKHYLNKKFDKYREKMRTVDIPLIKENNGVKEKTGDGIHIVYSGTLYPIRNPEFSCNCFSKLVGQDFKLDFFSRGSLEHIIEKYEGLTSGKIKRNGYIQREKLLEIIANSDFLLSIGNEGLEAIPSKIFEYMSALKPIIHFYKNDSDSCLPYLKNYPHVLMIKEDEKKIEEICQSLKDFMEKTLGKTIKYSEILGSFEMNTPKYTADILEKFL